MRLNSFLISIHHIHLRPWITSYAGRDSVHLSTQGGKNCRAMHLQHFAVGEGRLSEAKRWEFFHFTYFTLEQLHSEALLGFSFFLKKLYTRAEGEQKTSFRSNVLLLDGVSKLLFFFFSSVWSLGVLVRLGLFLTFRSFPHQAILIISS